MQPLHLAVLADGKFNRNFPSLEKWGAGGLRNDAVPVLFHDVQHLRQVWPKVHTLCVGEDLHRSYVSGWLPLAEPEVAFVASILAVSRRLAGSFVDRAAGRHRSRVK